MAFKNIYKLLKILAKRVYMNGLCFSFKNKFLTKNNKFKKKRPLNKLKIIINHK